MWGEKKYIFYGLVVHHEMGDRELGGLSFFY
jgi:hypothetical protein